MSRMKTTKISRAATAALCCTAILLLNGCQHVHRHFRIKDVTTQTVEEKCTNLKELHVIAPTTYGVPIRIIRLADCLSFKDLLAVTWRGGDDIVNRTAVKLVALQYIQYLNTANAPDRKSITPLKQDTFEDDTNLHVIFYEIVPYPG